MPSSPPPPHHVNAHASHVIFQNGGFRLCTNSVAYSKINGKVLLSNDTKIKMFRAIILTVDWNRF
jgi:hypothetical protein